jgi:hypothetical protein
METAFETVSFFKNGLLSQRNIQLDRRAETLEGKSKKVKGKIRGFLIFPFFFHYA